MENLRLIKMKTILANEVGYFHCWGIHNEETVAIIELSNQIIHATLVAQNKYNPWEANKNGRIER